MESAAQIIEELRGMGSASIKKVLINHGAQEPFFGVKIGDLMPLEKRLRPNYGLALELYASGISDAMYLAGLITDDIRMSREDLQTWAEGANWSLHSESTVPWVASGGRFGNEMALKWIESPVENIACAGWRTFSSLSLVKSDSELDLAQYEQLLDRVAETIHGQPNRVRYCMNGFVINTGSNIASITQKSIEAGRAIGKVSVMMGATACEVPFSPDYIQKVVEKGIVGKKKKSAKC